MCVFHSSQFTFMTRNQAAQPPNVALQRRAISLKLHSRLRLTQRLIESAASGCSMRLPLDHSTLPLRDILNSAYLLQPLLGGTLVCIPFQARFLGRGTAILLV